MKKTEQKQVMVSNLVKVTCDCCGAENNSTNWGKHSAEYQTASLILSDISDNVDWKTPEVDLCFECGKWLAQQILNQTIRRR